MKIRIYCDVDRDFIDNHFNNLLGKIQDSFQGQMIIIDVRGIPRNEQAMKGWYFSGIVPDFIGILKSLGHQVNPNDRLQREEVHQLFKEKFLSPLVDDLGNYVDEKGCRSFTPVYSTKNLGHEGWIAYISDIINAIEKEYGIILKPKKKTNADYNRYRNSS